MSYAEKKNVNKFKYDIYTCGQDEAVRFIAAAEILKLTPFVQGVVLTRQVIDNGVVVEPSENFLMHGHFPLENQKFLQQYIDYKLNMKKDDDKPLTWSIYSEIIGEGKTLFTRKEA